MIDIRLVNTPAYTGCRIIQVIKQYTCCYRLTSMFFFHENLSTAGWPISRQPYLLETSLPGVFAVGDVRRGSIKRVASAVGEGSIAISFVHKVLQE